MSSLLNPNVPNSPVTLPSFYIGTTCYWDLTSPTFGMPIPLAHSIYKDRDVRYPLCLPFIGGGRDRVVTLSLFKIVYHFHYS